MYKNIPQFLEGAASGVSKFNVFVEAQGLIGKIHADHICFKCGSSELFEEIRALFEGSTWFYQSIISNRRIAVVRLKSPIATLVGDITTLELSDQKPDMSQSTGFEHIEAYPTTISYDTLTAILSNAGAVYIGRPHHSTYDVDIGDRFLFRSTKEPLVKKIVAEQMS